MPMETEGGIFPTVLKILCCHTLHCLGAQLLSVMTNRPCNLLSAPVRTRHSTDPTWRRGTLPGGPYAAALAHARPESLKVLKGITTARRLVGKASVASKSIILPVCLQES